MKTNFTFKIVYNMLIVCMVLLASPVKAQTKYVVEVSNNVYTPNEIKIDVGDTVEWRNIQGFHNVNGTTSTFPDNPESFGNETDFDWTFTHVFTKPGIYNYQCDPHVGFGMIGIVEVENSSDDDKNLLTINFSSMNPHNGQNLYLSVVDKDGGKEVERKVEDINASFSVQISGIEVDHSYTISFFADHNNNGLYDTPPVDHAWQIHLDDVKGDTTLDFSHNISFTDIQWKYNVLVNFSGMNPHDNQTFHFFVKEAETGTEVYTEQTKVKPEFSLDASVLETGKSYYIDFYSDHNGNGSYDAPPADHAWRMTVENVSGDVVLNFAHNINFTDIVDITSAKILSELQTRIYPNPAKGIVSVEGQKDASLLEINFYDINGKKFRLNQVKQNNNTITFDISTLKRGIYIVEMNYDSERDFVKLIKQ